MRKLTLQFHRFNAVSDRQHLRGGILSEFQELAETNAISARAELANLYAQICKLRVRRGARHRSRAVDAVVPVQRNKGGRLVPGKFIMVRSLRRL